MKNIEYLNEHLLPGQIGHFAVILAFIAAAFSAVTYFLSVRKTKMLRGRNSDALDSLSIPEQ